MIEEQAGRVEPPQARKSESVADKGWNMAQRAVTNLLQREVSDRWFHTKRVQSELASDQHYKNTEPKRVQERRAEYILEQRMVNGLRHFDQYVPTYPQSSETYTAKGYTTADLFNPNPDPRLLDVFVIDNDQKTLAQNWNIHLPDTTYGGIDTNPFSGGSVMERAFNSRMPQNIVPLLLGCREGIMKTSSTEKAQAVSTYDLDLLSLAYRKGMAREPDRLKKLLLAGQSLKYHIRARMIRRGQEAMGISQSDRQADATSESAKLYRKLTAKKQATPPPATA